MWKLQETDEEDQSLIKEFDPECDEPDTPLPLTVTSRVLYMLGDLTAGPAYRFTQWLELVRKRTAQYRPSGFPHRPTSIRFPMPLRVGESDIEQKDSSPSSQSSGFNLWERLGKSATLDIESTSFCWDNLSSLHHTEHSSSIEQSEDDTSRTLEVTVNFGGVVFFALFKLINDDCKLKEGAAVIKFSSSRMATQSERLGYEFAKWLGVQIPQARVVHNTSSEWIRIKEAAQKAKSVAASERDEVGEMTCSELLEALELSRCLFLMKYALVDAELSKEFDQWNETLRNEVVKLCQENNFNTGFFEGNDNHTVVDAYELKVRLEHILERITLICDSANTEKPSSITNFLFISGALAARSVYTLQHLGITHVLCLCSNEIGQSDSQFPDLFQYLNFSIRDEEDSNISSIFNEACDFIDGVERESGKVLVHCFEGRSRSATLVLAYLMLRKNATLLEAWNTLKTAHKRAQPNDGFAKILQDLDKTLHGKVSMEWQQRKPSMKTCPICGKNVGLSSSSLKLHLQKAHKKLSSGSVDSAMMMEIQKAISALEISRSGSVSPTHRVPLNVGLED